MGDSSSEAAAPQADQDGAKAAQTVTNAVQTNAKAAKATHTKPKADHAKPAKSGEAILAPNKALRISAMLKRVGTELPQSPLDIQTRKELAITYHKAFKIITECLSPDLRAELKHLAPNIKGGKRSATPTDIELRLAYAQLVGWLEGLFTGIQALLGGTPNPGAPQLTTIRPGFVQGAVATSPAGAPTELVAETRPGQYL
ncbi:MAG: bacterial proteasome activator family protein [Cellulomonadaceae bacterium]|jgi:hypothetical protein|nr:bacterial proteasome activator family protein [Cellulomonadaceae bacterium]